MSNSTKTGSTKALFALAFGAFGIGVTEFSPMGMLPEIAQGVDVSIPAAGLLVSAYALGVMVGAPLMTLLLSRYGKRHALIGLVAIFTVGNLLSAMAPGYWTLLAARVVTSLNHGAFFGLGAVVAAGVVAPERQASAVATMFMGLTLANVAGVPIATWVAQTIGWRSSFFGTAGIGLLVMASLWASLPSGLTGAKPNVRREIKVLMRPNVLLALFTTVVGASAMFTLYTYVAPFLTVLGGAAEATVTYALVVIGLGFTIGNWAGGRLADWSLDGATVIFLILLAAISVLLSALAQSTLFTMVALLFWGAAAFALVPPVQMRVMRSAADAPGLASSVNIGAFNLGNAIGAAAGGAVLNAGLGYSAIPIAAGLFAASGLLLVGASWWLSQRNKETHVGEQEYA